MNKGAERCDIIKDYSVKCTAQRWQDITCCKETMENTESKQHIKNNKTVRHDVFSYQPQLTTSLNNSGNQDIIAALPLPHLL